MAEGHHDRFDGILSDESIDELVDLRLRREFSRAFPAGGDPVGELNDLVPAIRRARTVYRLRNGALGAAAALVMVVGVGAAMNRLPGLDDQTVAADAPPDGDDDGGAPEVIGDAIEITGTTEGDESETAAPTVDRAIATSGQVPPASSGANGTPPDDTVDDAASSPAAGDAQPTGSATTVVAPPTPAPTAPQPPPTSGPSIPTTAVAPTPTATAPTMATSPTTATTSPPATTADGDTVVSSKCGSISVSTTGSYVFLAETDPRSGYETDVKSNGPYKVEVGFKGHEHGRVEEEDQECQITARVIDGSLSVSVED